MPYLSLFKPARGFPAQVGKASSPRVKGLLCTRRAGSPWLANPTSVPLSRLVQTSVLCLDMICLMGTSSSAIALLQGTIRAHRLADVVQLGLI